MRLFVVVTAVLAAVSVVPAQRTWVVDAAGGPGSHFRDIPAAVNSVTVVHDDRILVRPGTYRTAKIAKGVRLLGGTGRLLRPGTLEITGIPAGRTLAIKGFTFTGDFCKVIVSGNQGGVHIEGLRAAHRGTFGFPNHSFRIDSSRAVTLADSSVAGGDWSAILGGRIDPPIVIDGSTVVMSSVVARAVPANDAAPTASVPCVWATGSQVTVESCQFTGADAYYWFVSGPIAGWVGPTEAMVGIGSKLRITGSQNLSTRFSAGAPWGSGQTAAGLRLSASTAVVDPGAARVKISSIRAPVGTVVRRHIPSLLAWNARPGSFLSAAVDSVPQAPFYLFVGNPHAPLVSFFGNIWLDPATVVLVANGLLNSRGQGGVVVPVPGGSRFDGTLLAFQALVQNGSEILISPPAVTVIH